MGGQAACSWRRPRSACTCCSLGAAGADDVPLPDQPAIEAHPRVELHTRTRIVRMEGNGNIEQIAGVPVADGPSRKTK